MFCRRLMADQLLSWSGPSGEFSLKSLARRSVWLSFRELRWFRNAHASHSGTGSSSLGAGHRGPIRPGKETPAGRI